MLIQKFFYLFYICRFFHIKDIFRPATDPRIAGRILMRQLLCQTSILPIVFELSAIQFNKSERKIQCICFIYSNFIAICSCYFWKYLLNGEKLRFLMLIFVFSILAYYKTLKNISFSRERKSMAKSIASALTTNGFTFFQMFFSMLFYKKIVYYAFSR